MSQNPSSVPNTDDAPPVDATALQAEIETLRQQVTDTQEKFLRARAEADNIRKRADSDVASAHKYAIERFAAEVLGVRDSLEHARAVDMQASGIAAKVMEGLDLTLKLMDAIFEKFGLMPVSPAAGEKFDPERHQAMGLTETTEFAPNCVMKLMQKGYVLNGRLLRPALVFVSKAPLAAEAEAPGNA